MKKLMKMLFLLALVSGCLGTVVAMGGDGVWRADSTSESGVETDSQALLDAQFDGSDESVEGDGSSSVVMPASASSTPAGSDDEASVIAGQNRGSVLLPIKKASQGQQDAIGRLLGDRPEEIRGANEVLRGHLAYFEAQLSHLRQEGLATFVGEQGLTIDEVRILLKEGEAVPQAFVQKLEERIAMLKNALSVGESLQGLQDSARRDGEVEEKYFMPAHEAFVAEYDTLTRQLKDAPDFTTMLREVIRVCQSKTDVSVRLERNGAKWVDAPAKFDFSDLKED